MEQNNLYDRLCEKMSEEQAEYRSNLMAKSPQEILDHAYEYTVREDILCAMVDCGDLSEKQLTAFLNCPSPLSAIYNSFMKCETDHMDVLRDCIFNEADKQMEHRPVSSLQAKLAEAKAAIQNRQPVQTAKHKSQEQSL